MGKNVTSWESFYFKKEEKKEKEGLKAYLSSLESLLCQTKLPLQVWLVVYWY